ncbi:recombination regulator RecX [Stenoxybacter acetivorans]|uniref:recombination regulator RecX n=1 Tax=Stenoxybacter acetivorans TaxID=422441 RepID=UPI00055E5832|nr:recombination regulator RecX [Stenoxybacter acetivorans]
MKQNISLRQRALNILARCEISRAELAKKLMPHCGSEAELNQLLDELAEKHWQSDSRFTESYVHSKSRLHGNLRLQYTLAQKGIDEQTIRDYLPSKQQQMIAAAAVIHKKFRQPPSNLQEKHKYMRFLAYRGFEMDIIQAALRQAWLPETDDDVCLAEERLPENE